MSHPHCVDQLYIYLVFSPYPSLAGTRAQSGNQYGSGTLLPGKFLGVGCHFFPPPLDVPTFSARCLYVQRRERPPAAEGGTLCGREMFRQILA